MIFQYLPPKQHNNPLWRCNVGKKQIIYNVEQFECISDDVYQGKYITTSCSLSVASSDHRWLAQASSAQCQTH